MSKQFVLKLDSHQLTAFQECEQYFKYNIIDNLELAQAPLIQLKLRSGEVQQLENADHRRGLNIGTLHHKCLDLNYRLIRRGYDAQKAMFLTTRRIDKFAKQVSVSNADKLLFTRKFLEYCSFYFDIDRYVSPVGVEAGFSHLLYADQSFKFIYEGKIDLIFVNKNPRLESPGLLEPMDHKTQTMKYAINPYSNQFIGYAWAMRKQFGALWSRGLTVNIFGIQESLPPKECFQRFRYQYPDRIIDDWVRSTIIWYRRIAQSIIWRNYTRSRTACDRKYGRCEFFGLCSAQEQEFYDDRFHREYKLKNRIFEAWE